MDQIAASIMNSIEQALVDRDANSFDRQWEALLTSETFIEVGRVQSASFELMDLHGREWNELPRPLTLCSDGDRDGLLGSMDRALPSGGIKTAIRYPVGTHHVGAKIEAVRGSTDQRIELKGVCFDGTKPRVFTVELLVRRPRGGFASLVKVYQRILTPPFLPDLWPDWPPAHCTAWPPAHCPINGEAERHVLMSIFPSEFNFAITSITSRTEYGYCNGYWTPFGEFVRTVAELVHDVGMRIASGAAPALEDLGVWSLPFVGIEPAIAALRNAQSRAAVHLFRGAIDRYCLTPETYESPQLARHEVFAASVLTSFSSPHEHMDLLVGQLQAITRLYVRGKNEDPRAREHCHAAARVLAEEVRYLGPPLLSERLFIVAVEKLFEAAEGCVSFFAQRYRTEESVRRDIAQHPDKSYMLRMLDLSGPFFVALTDLVAAYGSVDEKRWLLDLFQRVDQQNQQFQYSAVSLRAMLAPLMARLDTMASRHSTS